MELKDHRKLFEQARDELGKMFRKAAGTTKSGENITEIGEHADGSPINTDGSAFVGFIGFMAASEKGDGKGDPLDRAMFASGAHDVVLSLLIGGILEILGGIGKASPQAAAQAAIGVKNYFEEFAQKALKDSEPKDIV